MPIFGDSDTRGMVRLAHEVGGFVDNWRGRKRFFMERLCQLVEADAWYCGFCDGDSSPMPAALVPGMYGGMSEDAFSRFTQAYCHPEMCALIGPFFRETAGAGMPATKSFQKIVPNTVFEKSGAFAHWNENNLFPACLSVTPLADGTFSYILFLCRGEARYFDDRQAHVVHALVTEMEWVHERLEQQDNRVVALSPRLRVIHEMLVQGLSRKCIARKLGLSLHTVNGYVKVTYQHFGVRSHAELIHRSFRGNASRNFASS